MRLLSHRCLASFHLSPSLLYRWQFSQSSCFSSWCLVWNDGCDSDVDVWWPGAHPLTEADHWPHGAAQAAAATEEPEQQPAHVDRQRLPQSHVNTGYCRLEQSSCKHLQNQNLWRLSDKVTLNSSGATLEWSEVGNSVSNLLDKPNLKKVRMVEWDL